MTLHGWAMSPRETFPTPTSPEYANLPIWDGFNWAQCLRSIPATRLYLVVFRSVRRVTADVEMLKRYDDAAYAEALEEGGLLHYFKGEANERRECLSFCLWESREHALKAVKLPAHQAAASIAAGMYESYDLERYEVGKDGAPGEETISFERLAGW